MSMFDILSSISSVVLTSVTCLMMDLDQVTKDTVSIPVHLNLINKRNKTYHR